MFQQYILYLQVLKKKKKKNLSVTIGRQSKALDAYAKNATAEINTHHVRPLSSLENIFLNGW